jgi:Prolyl oligopeptidase family
MSKLVKCAIGFVVAVLAGAGVVMLAIPGRLPAPPISEAELTNVVNEVMSVGELYRSPEPNHALTELVYMKAMEGRRGASRVDLKSGSVTVLPLKAEARMLFSWSPDDRYLLLKDAPHYNERLLLYDAVDGSFRPATQEKNFGVAQAVWVGTNRFAYISKRGKSAEMRLVSLGQPCRVVRTFPNPGTMDWMVGLSGDRVAYLENREVWVLDLKTGAAEQVTTNLCSQYLWLNCAPETGEFLFCSADGSDWRHLFKLGTRPPDKGKLTQLSFGPDHSYNGQWIQGGTGFAYVGNITNHFYLAVRPADPKLRTNLFVGGHVLAYRVGADGNTLYAAAALGMEPPAIWRYDIRARALRCIVPGTNQPFVTARVLPAEARWAESFDGLQIPYYLIKPRGMESRSTYPAVLAVPPEAGQFVQAWEKYGQFLGNIGVFYAALNPRGSDGYGKPFKENKPEEAWRDILAVRKQLLEDPNVDPKRCFLLTWSNGSRAVNRVVAEHPGLWAGVILISGGAPNIGTVEHALPPYFIFIGDKDRRGLRPGIKRFKQWADANGADVTLMVDARTTHIITDINVDRRLGYAFAQFIFHHHKQAPFATAQSSR